MTDKEIFEAIKSQAEATAYYNGNGPEKWPKYLTASALELLQGLGYPQQEIFPIAVTKLDGYPPWLHQYGIPAGKDRFNSENLKGLPIIEQGPVYMGIDYAVPNVVHSLDAAINNDNVKHNLTGGHCSVCGKPQYQTPSGITCGVHGGAPELVEPGSES